MKPCSISVHSIEFDEFYMGPSFAFVGPLLERILPGCTEIINDLLLILRAFSAKGYWN